MLAKPNRTVIEGTVRAIQAASDGQGAELTIEVARNASPSPDADFLKPAKGDVIELFAAENPSAAVGERVRVHARLLAGPFGSRTVLEKIERLTST